MLLSTKTYKVSKQDQETTISVLRKCLSLLSERKSTTTLVLQTSRAFLDQEVITCSYHLLARRAITKVTVSFLEKPIDLKPILDTVYIFISIFAIHNAIIYVLLGPGPADYNIKSIFDVNYDFRIIDKIINNTAGS